MLTYIRSKISDSDSLYNKVLGEEKGWVHSELGCGHDIERSHTNSEKRRVSVLARGSGKQAGCGESTCRRPTTRIIRDQLDGALNMEGPAYVLGR
jgi:hypothetical protein